MPTSSEVRLCHLSICNPEVEVYCHNGLPGGKSAPYSNINDIYCSAWNIEHGVCNLTLQPHVIVNVSGGCNHGD